MARSGLGNITPAKKGAKLPASVAKGKHGRNRPLTRDKRVGVSVSADELQELRLWAAQRGVSMADLLRQAAWKTLGNEKERESFLSEPD